MDSGQVISIDALPDDILLEIFNSHGYDYTYQEEREKVWQKLVHVCRRWRCIVLGSPRRLNLQLVCTTRTPVRDMLDVWPAFPLIIESSGHPRGSMDNIIVALGCTDRVHQISLRIVQSFSLDILLAMQHPFPELTRLVLSLDDETVPVFPDSFLGGSAPRLESLLLYDIPFPGLPKLLSSATHLYTLQLENIPHSGYFSPNAMVAALSTLTSLQSLTLVFESPRSCPDQASRLPPPKTRSVLPVLTYFEFKGVSEYLDDLVACIDAPQLNKLEITFFNDIVFDTPQLVRFISHTPRSKALEKAYINLRNRSAWVSFFSQTSGNVMVKSCAKGWIGKFHLWSRSVPRACLPFLSWRTSISTRTRIRNQIGTTASRTDNGWGFFAHLWLSRMSIYPRSLRLVSRFPSKSSLRSGQQTCCLPCKTFT